MTRRPVRPLARSRLVALARRRGVLGGLPGAAAATAPRLRCHRRQPSGGAAIGTRLPDRASPRRSPPVRRGP